MVKGVSRRVVVVRPDECGVFEQAIFLVRDYDAPRSDVVRERSASWGWHLPLGCWRQARYGRLSACCCEAEQNISFSASKIVEFSYGLYIIFDLY